MTQLNKMDGAETIFAKSELEHIQVETDDNEYPDYLWSQFIPNGSFGMAPEDDVYTVNSYDRAGLVKWIQAYGEDLPKVNIKKTSTSVVAKEFGNSYGFSDDEIAKAARHGIPLDREGADTARMAHEAFLDVLGSVGDATVGMKGLLNLANALSFTPSTKGAGGLTWGTLAAPNATPLEIIGDLNGITAAVIAATKAKGMFSPNAIILPIEQYTHIALRPMTADSQVTILQFFLKNNPWIKTVDHWYRCDAAGGGGTDRMVCYRRDPKTVKFIIPRNFQQKRVRERDGESVDCKTKTAGVVSSYPLTVCYGDGI